MHIAYVEQFLVAPTLEEPSAQQNNHENDRNDHQDGAPIAALACCACGYRRAWAVRRTEIAVSEFSAGHCFIVARGAVCVGIEYLNALVRGCFTLHSGFSMFGLGCPCVSHDDGPFLGK